MRAGRPPPGGRNRPALATDVAGAPLTGGGEAHRRNLRVITELVINHTSDQHPWFQGARRAPPGSTKRNYYVWSDTDKRYAGTTFQRLAGPPDKKPDEKKP